jgi:hypothetical protein
MSITLLTGAPGHGKSYTSVKLIDGFVSKGKCVVTNVALRADWAIQMARYHTLFGFLRKRAVKRKAELYATRVHVCQDIDEIIKVRFEGTKEGRAEVIIEEAHRSMNVRGSSRGKSTEAQKRKLLVEYASGHRHYGCNLTLITQAAGNLDAQIRGLYEFHAEVRNFRKLPIIGWFVRLLPGGNLFIKITRWNDKTHTKAGVVSYGLSKRLANLYSTHSLQESDWPTDAIVLPRKSGIPGTPVPSVPEMIILLPPWSNGVRVDPPSTTNAERKRIAKKAARLSIKN